jgi:uncharacterized membrane protein YphA (DoxX/SURF4 family)
MRDLSKLGRIFFGTAIAGMGVLTICYHDLPYMLIPSKYSWIPGLTILSFVFGALLIVAGACIVLKKKTRPVALLLGTALLLIFCFYFIPYQFMVSPDYLHFGDWENAAKELALAGGAFVIAGCFPEVDESPFNKFLSNLMPLGKILFSITIISFGVDHFLYAKEAADYVPSWVPCHLFFMYVTGTALLASGFALILNIWSRLAAALLGIMIFTWFAVLHIPRVVTSPAAYMGSEVTSAFIALAYCGTAFVIAGIAKKNK